MLLKILPLIFLLFTSNIFAQKITANWMGILYKDHSNILLSDIIIPGTHDSATYTINKKSPFPSDAPKFFKAAKKTVAKMSKTQNKDIYTQLLRGNRYLDLRITDYQNKLFIVHGMLGVELETVLKDIRKFTIKYPREIIIIDFQKMPKAEYFSMLHELVQKYLGDFLYFRKIDPVKITFKHLWRNQRSILPVMDGDEFIKIYPRYFKRSAFLKSDWANTTKRNILEQKLKKFLEDQDLTKFHVGYLTLTPDTKYILKGIFSPKTNIYRLNKEVFNSPGEWLPKWKEEGIKLNIISVDFEADSNLFETVLRLNKEALRDQ